MPMFARGRRNGTWIGTLAGLLLAAAGDKDAIAQGARPEAAAATTPDYRILPTIHWTMSPTGICVATTASSGTPAAMTSWSTATRSTGKNRRS